MVPRVGQTVIFIFWEGFQNRNNMFFRNENFKALNIIEAYVSLYRERNSLTTKKIIDTHRK
jgi:hypothetical protein